MPADLKKQAAVIKPAAVELKRQQIPWVTDLTHALKLARAEDRSRRSSRRWAVSRAPSFSCVWLESFVAKLELTSQMLD